MGLAASLDDVVTAAARLLGETLTVDADLSFSARAVVARVRRPSGGTLVLKRPAEELGFRRELAAYEALPARTRADLLAHGDGILVLEDLGTGPSLADLLLSRDAEPARAGLLAWARGVGRMAAATVGRAPTEGEVFPGRGDIDASRTLALAKELGLTRMRKAIGAEVREIVALLDPPGAWTALTPADVCPDNNRITDGTARFFDFEFSSWHHVALDISFCRLPFSTCWCVAALPPGLPEQMETALLSELGDVDTAALDHAAVLAGAWFVLDTIASLWKRTEDHAPQPPIPMTGRERARFRLTWLAAQADALPACAALAQRCVDALDGRYGAFPPVPTYPAFR